MRFFGTLPDLRRDRTPYREHPPDDHAHAEDEPLDRVREVGPFVEGRSNDRLQRRVVGRRRFELLDVHRLHGRVELLREHAEIDAADLGERVVALVGLLAGRPSLAVTEATDDLDRSLRNGRDSVALGHESAIDQAAASRRRVAERRRRCGRCRRSGIG